MKKKAKISAVKWKNAYKWQFEAYPLFASVYQKSAAPTRNKYFTRFHDLLNNFSNGQVYIFEPRKEIFNKGAIIINELLRGDKSFYREFKRVFQEINTAIKICEKCRREGRYKEIEKWWPVTQHALSDVTYILFNFDYPLDDFLKKLSMKLPKDFELVSKSIFTKEISFIDEANSALIKLNKKYPNNFKKVMNEFVKEYGWFQNSYFGKFKITEKWLREYLKEIKKEKKKRIKSNLNFKLPREYKLLVKTASLAIKFRDDKKKLLLLVSELVDDWLKEICKEKKWSYEAMRWLSMDEILEILNAPFIKGGKEELHENFKKAKVYSKKNKRIGLMNEIGYSEISEGFWKKVLKQQEMGNKKEFSGVIANRGKYRGIVKVIIDAKKEKNNLKEGDILVTSMTRPEFFPLMAKAGAFVTDEGGISCHAAIIAREMGKPCIIGTKIATRILRNGQIVEVDANKGIIKILKNEKSD